MKKPFCITMLLLPFWANAAVFPDETQLKMALENLETPIDDGVKFSKDYDLFEDDFIELHSKFLKEAGKNIEVCWVIYQINILYQSQVDRLDVKKIAQIDRFDGSVHRRIANLDSRNYFPKLFDILFVDDADKQLANEEWSVLKEKMETVIRSKTSASNLDTVNRKIFSFCKTKLHMI